MKTAKQIAKIAEPLTDRGSKTVINRLYRKQDESHLFPINGRFNATERAIRRARKFEQDSGCALYGLDYCYFLEQQLSEIVNAE